MSFFLGLVVVVSCSQALAPWNPSMRMRPGTCDHYECPTYKLGYEIRMYNSAVWMSTDPITAPSIAGNFNHCPRAPPRLTRRGAGAGRTI
ncbi:hypothetical protein YC2023_080796 [Brassica napus]